MVLTDPMTILFLVGISLAAGGFTVLFGNYLARRGPGPSHVLLRGMDLPLIYVFRDGYLLTDPVETDPLLGAPVDRVGAWAELKEALGALNPDAGPRMEALRDHGGSFVLIGRIGEDELSVSGRLVEGRCIITVASLVPGRDKRMIDRAGLDALEAEIDLLRHGLDASRDLLWQTGESGQITWANRAYYDLLAKVDRQEEGLTWPIRDLFPDVGGQPSEDGQPRRMRLDLPDGGAPAWIEVSGVEHGRGWLFTGRRIERLVAAEVSLREFVQTLSRTFAHLPIGLAIFDRRRELVLFNPALVSLSTLPGDWLSARPHLHAVLDRLREKQRMPEPKNYQAWRASLGELERAAQDGTYQELWTLPNGQTFRVIGRPHADGGVAFLFEDISQEVTLTRKFRGDLDLYQSVMDDCEEAMCVFGRDGRQVMANARYRALWPKADSAGTVTEASRIWQAASDPTPLWGEIRDFVGGYADRSAWSEGIVLSDGRALACRVAPLKGGASLVAFLEQAPPLPARGRRKEGRLVSAS